MLLACSVLLMHSGATPIQRHALMLLTLGFFVCGFQVVFVGVHLPAYLADKGMPAHVAVMANRARARPAAWIIPACGYAATLMA